LRFYSIEKSRASSSFFVPWSGISYKIDVASRSGMRLLNINSFVYLHMSLFIRNLLRFVQLNPIEFRDPETERQFLKWLRPSRQSQMGAISALTGLLYLINAVINYFTAPPEILMRMLTIHVLVMPSFLFMIAYLSFRTQLYSLIIFILMIAPVVANAASFYILSYFTGVTTHLTEAYLSLLWIFIVAGLTLHHALISALLSFIVILYGAFHYLNFTTQELTYHLFWIMCSISFGILGGYLIERASRHNFLTHLELEKLAVRDNLTGLYNRNRFDEVLPKELERNKRFNHSFGLILMDLDYFKNVNDTYGHGVGDRVLISLAELFLQNTRSTDYVFRWGGEEFVIISPETDENGIVSLAEALRTTVFEFEFPVIKNASISAGVTVSRQSDSMEEIMERADKALYRAKSEGRNIVIPCT